MFISLLAAKAGIKAEKAMDFGEKQVNIILGSEGKSHMVGYGTHFAKFIHHRAAYVVFL